MDASRAPRTVGTGETDCVVRLASCRLKVTQTHWDYAVHNASAIDAYWQRRSAENPAMFNGVIHMMTAMSIDGAHLSGDFARTDFKSFLHWREHGYRTTGTRDAFCSALVTSAEGGILLGRQRSGHLNGGRYHLPGGLIDPRDVAADSTISIDASILREVEEEIGILASEVEVVPGYLAIFTGPLLSIARELKVRAPTRELLARVSDHIAGDPQSELTEVIAVRQARDLDGLPAPPYAADLLKWHFTNRG